MENMIKRILEIDSKAREMTAKAEATRTEVKASIKQKKNDLREEYMAKMQAKIADFEKNEHEEAKSKMEENDKHNNEVLNRLNDLYKEKSDEWVETLFERSIM